jgi:hypothetical protein
MNLAFHREIHRGQKSFAAVGQRGLSLKQGDEAAAVETKLARITSFSEA